MLPSLLDRLFGRRHSSAEPDLRVLKIEPPKIWSEQFPDVPKPDTGPSIQLVAARWACNDLHGEDMPRIAADLLEVGFDSPALCRLSAETSAACSADIELLVARVFGDFGIPYPMPENQAQLIFAPDCSRGHCWTSRVVVLCLRS